MTTTAYPPLTQAQQIFYDLVWTPAIRAGETYLETNVGFLALPVVKDLDEAAIRAITDWAFHTICLWIDVTAIRLVNGEHQRAYDEASVELAIVATQEGILSDAYQKQRAVWEQKLSQFSRLPGS